MLIATACWGLAACGPGGSAKPTARPTPVVLISIDTLRADALGCYGYQRDTSPALDAFARQAVRFEAAIVQSNATPSSHAAMLTGIDPTVLRFGARFPANEHSLDPKTATYGYGLLDGLTPTIQSRLREAGWSTGGFTAHEGWLGPKNGFDLGFDHFETGYPTAPENNARVARWLAATPARPLFLFLHDYDVHSDFEDLPYRVPAPFFGRYSNDYHGPFDGSGGSGRKASELLQWMAHEKKTFPPDEIRYIRGLYDEGIRYTDFQINRLFDLLRQNGLWDEALIIVTADHGEEFQEHGGLLHYQLYDETLRVPLLIRFPQAEWAGLVVRPQVRCIDIAPTVLDYLGLEPLRLAHGASLLPLIEATARGLSTSDIAALDSGHGSFSYGDGNGVLRTSEGKFTAHYDKREEFYDLRHDSGELNNLIASASPLEETYRQRLIDLFSKAKRQGEAMARLRGEAGHETRSFSREDLQRLAQQGYVSK